MNDNHEPTEQFVPCINSRPFQHGYHGDKSSSSSANSDNASDKQAIEPIKSI
jgi:hypothetical protein